MSAAPKIPHARDLPGVTTIAIAPPEQCLCQLCFGSFSREEMANKGRDRKGREREPTECKRCYNDRKMRSYDPKKKRRSSAVTMRDAEARKKRVLRAKRKTADLCSECGLWRGAGGTKNRCRRCADSSRDSKRRTAERAAA